ncbi:hypothetical protein [Leptolyngbya sp. FACHB-261]|uniref:hypothetical protein n=1 Tax=Leptolyngbya sp. FACHB-261 TaxID=2692806 RepID=UPI001689F722|nr:hypothetical protein [Leptolyngbya sp. FACHB-261]MBD2105050.1 hypothetical protein [Leptolyngbya sp. FACHB-261]
MAYDSISADPQSAVSTQTRAAAAQIWQELSRSGMVVNAPCLGFTDARAEEYYIDIPDEQQELIDVAQAAFPPKPGHCVIKEAGHHWWRFALR